METWETLEKALALIEPEENWCQGAFESSPGVYCAEGSCRAVLGLDGMARTAEYIEVRIALRKQLPVNSNGEIHFFNDSHSHAEVVALFKRAIAAEKAKAGVFVEVPERVAEHV